MNLDLFPLGWVHLVASLAALAAGILVVLRPRRAALAGSDPQFPSGPVDPPWGDHRFLGADRLLQCRAAAEVSLTKRRAPPIDYAESLGEHGVASTRRG